MANKSKDRVQKYYEEGTRDWEAQYNMLHDDGVTCNDCKHAGWCKLMIGISGNETSCDWYPNRFVRQSSN